MEKRLPYENALVKEALDSAGTRQALSQDIGVGTATLWRAQRGWRVDRDVALKLVRRFPQLNVDALQDGDPNADPEPKRAAKRPAKRTNAKRAAA